MQPGVPREGRDARRRPALYFMTRGLIAAVPVPVFPSIS